ncbi:MAG TPA: carbohydrate kinase family protein [Longimicrobiaceae bacterium]|nr:carbohydrate kinase family protein [Longimicrobiaceae bacterium]
MKRVGVLGTLVYDTIWHPAGVRGVATEQWGGIAYSLAGFSVAVPPGWEVIPIVKIGADLATDAEGFIGALPAVAGSALRVVPEQTNRVELRYADASQRSETLTGGVPGWSWGELAPLVEGLDALYVNFISGFELTLVGAQELRSSFRGPIYADLHSLFLGDAGDAPRKERQLENAREWLACFDAVQVNVDECRLLAGHNGWEHYAREALDRGLSIFVTTCGADGASYIGRGLRSDLPLGFAGLASGTAAVPGGPVQGDPTGCGDVWGSVFFCGLLAEYGADGALHRANIAAAQKARSANIRELRTGLAAVLAS